ncbi:MAG: hypothetical protein L6R37_006629 [Teloschistes peruensis]|nr:MAG: hypothetical protein L6R37_006629 [Teloschistes peruensis]
MPAYVTSQGALEPFEADVERDTEQANETRTAQTRLYVINQNANLAQIGVNSTTTNMIPFALGLTRLPPAQYADPQKLGASMEQAHKLLHALALQQLMSQEVHSNDQRPGVVSGRSRAIVVIRPLTIAVEGLLGLVILLTLALLIYAHNRPSRLSKDPASLADMMNLIAKNPKLSPLSSDQRLEEKSFKLECDRLLGRRSETQSSNRNTNSRQEQTLEKTKEGSTITGTSQQVRGVRPIEMSLSVGIAFVPLLLLALVTVVAIKVYADRHTGLPLPSYNELVN